MQIYQSLWVTFPSEVRDALRTKFKITRSEGCTVVDNQVVSDGSNNQDLSILTDEFLRAFTNSKEQDFDTLVALTIKKVMSPEEVLGAKEEIKEVKEEVKPVESKSIERARKIIKKK